MADRLAPNRYPGACAACGDPVERYAGLIEWAGMGRYHVLHRQCIDSPERSAAQVHGRQRGGGSCPGCGGEMLDSFCIDGCGYVAGPW